MTPRLKIASDILCALLSNPQRYDYIAAKVASGELSQAEATNKNVHKALLIADALIAEHERTRPEPAPQADGDGLPDPHNYRSDYNSLIQLIAEQTYAVGIGETMTAEDRVRRVCAELARLKASPPAATPHEIPESVVEACIAAYDADQGRPTRQGVMRAALREYDRLMPARAAEYLLRIMPEIGCGDDPLGFLIASHEMLSIHHQRDRERIAVLEAENAGLRERKDGAYEERNRVVALLARFLEGDRSKTAIEGWSEDWHGCVYVDTPEGQLSWHYHDSQAHLFDGLPERPIEWDGHTTKEKYARIERLCAAIDAAREGTP